MRGCAIAQRNRAPASVGFASLKDTHVLPQPMRGLSQRPEPWRMSKSTCHRRVPALPDEFAVLDGRKMRTWRWWSEPESQPGRFPGHVRGASLTTDIGAGSFERSSASFTRSRLPWSCAGTGALFGLPSSVSSARPLEKAARSTLGRASATDRRATGTDSILRTLSTTTDPRTWRQD